MWGCWGRRVIKGMLSSSNIARVNGAENITFAGNVANQVIVTQEFLDAVYEVKNPYSELVYADHGT